MLKKRVIFTLLYDNASFMLSRNFRLQKVGDLQWLKKNYNFSHISFSIDELIILDVTRGERNEKRFFEHVRSLTEECFVPIAAGGGIRTLDQARKLLHSGADKVVLNTLVAENSDVITEISKEFGRQSIVISVDVRKIGDEYVVFTKNGTLQQDSLEEWLERLDKVPAGELYINSIDNDGTGHGYRMDIINHISKHINMPVIMSGGAGKYQHFIEGLNNDGIDAVSTAHLFNFVGNGLECARVKLRESDFILPKWDPKLADLLKGSLVKL